MQVRLVRLKGSPEGVAERRAVFEREAVPALREQPGFVGVVVLGDPQTGAGAVATYWESEEAATRSREAMAALRERVTAGQGLEVLSIEECEVTLMERRGQATPGNAVRLTRASGNPNRGDEVVAHLRGALAEVSALPGFRALISGVDRSSGRFYVVSGWDTAADREASEAATAEHRARLVEVAEATDVEVDRYEIVLAEMPAPVAGT